MSNLRVLGNFVYSDFQGIYSLNLQTKEKITLDFFSGRIHTDVNVRDGKVYYLRTQASTIGFGPGKIYSANIEGGQPEQFTFGTDYENNLVVSDDGSILAFSSDNNSDKSDRYKITILNTEDRNSAVLIQNKDYSYIFLNWSPNNKNLVFFENTKPGISGRLFLYNLNDKSLTELLPEKLLLCTQIAWSPDGEKIALGIIEKDQIGIYIYTIKSKNLQKIINIDKKPENIQWSSQSDFLIYEISNSSRQTNEPMGLYFLNIKTGILSALQEGSIDGNFYSYRARWSSDGKFVEYNINPEKDLWVIRVQNVVSGNSYDIEFLEPFTFYPESWEIIEN